MINKQDLQKLIDAGESDRVEFTESTDKKEKFHKAICAFANDNPKNGQSGYLLIGVKSNGCLSGLQADDRLLTNLSFLLIQNSGKST